jgi:hypothetical protein
MGVRIQMTDYYSLIAEAVAEKRGHETRIIIYERARAGLRELYKRGRLTSAEFAIERAELDEAISKFEAAAWRRQRDLNQLKSVLAEVTQEQGGDASPAAPIGTEANVIEDALAGPERQDLGQPEPEPTVAAPPDPAQFSPQEQAPKPDVVGQLDVAPTDAPEDTSASAEALTPEDIVNSDVAKPSTGRDAFGSDAAPSAEQVVDSDKDWEQAVDHAVAEVRRAAVDQADLGSREDASTDIDDAAPAVRPADQSSIDASGIEQTGPGTPSPAADEQQQSVKPAADERA